jgi:hypothetical protein
VGEHLAGLLGRIDVAVGDYRNLHPGLHQGDGVVLGFAHVLVGPGAAVDGDGLNATVFGDMGDGRGVAGLAAVEGLALER